ncbi:MAG: SUMF1/EgtB/PvdO family nonheme iron enzyme [Planctomycetes bacterium]|nr:SUMF1/EgtB/PvdO family nonheme iron enzyme [Planctomycetota bacterium]
MEEEVVLTAERFGLSAAATARVVSVIRRGRGAAEVGGVFAAQPFTGEPLWREVALGAGRGRLWMMAVPVTVGMYRCFDSSYRLYWRRKWHDAGSVAAFEPKKYRGRGRGSNERPTAAHPASVTWYEAVAFTRWLNAVAAKSPELVCGAGERAAFAALVAAGWRFRLPWEHEWELACRAGTTSRWSCGNVLTAEYAWFGEIWKGAPHPVGLLSPNGFGLRDMHGNIFEWCLDAYERETNPDGCRGGRGSRRMARGGSFRHPALLCSSGIRARVTPAFRFDRFGVDDVGFRPVLAAPLPGSSIEHR